jgi:hypothetical protein
MLITMSRGWASYRFRGIVEVVLTGLISYAWKWPKQETTNRQPTAIAESEI